MPEILGDAGVYFDPISPISIRKAIEKIIIDSEYREKISKLAIKNSNKFSWKKSADQLFSALSELANEYY